MSSNPDRLHITVLGVGHEAGRNALGVLDELARDYALDVRAVDHARADEEVVIIIHDRIEVSGPPSRARLRDAIETTMHEGQ
ncbi:MAG: hypothetical protein U0Q47_12520 [Mycobacterium sp.]|jgi:hypothetical protein